tara:strand:- start:329 stop:505 length:177 start_codon:yes stop_codon:yes gene_type:complete
MTTQSIKQFIQDNKQLIADKCAEYCEACSISLSEFNEEQQHALRVTIATTQLKELIEA